MDTTRSACYAIHDHPQIHNRVSSSKNPQEQTSSVPAWHRVTEHPVDGCAVFSQDADADLPAHHVLRYSQFQAPNRQQDISETSEARSEERRVGKEGESERATRR